jgi:hypothetical protein
MLCVRLHQSDRLSRDRLGISLGINMRFEVKKRQRHHGLVSHAAQFDNPTDLTRRVSPGSQKAPLVR